MSFDQHANFGYSRIVTPPSPALSGTTLTVSTGEGALFPPVPFNATIWPVGQNPTATNAEIVRVTNITGDDFTITRAQELTAAVAIGQNYQIANTATKKVFTDIEEALTSVNDVISNMISAGSGGGVTMDQVSARAEVASAAATSVDARVNALSDLHSVLSQAVSVMSVALSNEISARAAASAALELHASTASAAATSVDGRVNALSDLHSVLSQRVSVLSSNLSLTNSALTSVDSHANAASAAATSVDARVNTVSNLVSALTSAHNALSNVVSAAGFGAAINMVSMQNVDAGAASAGCPVYAFTSANTFKKADASATGTELVLGLVADNSIAVSAVGRIQTFGTVSLTSAQWSDITSVGTGLTPGDLYFLHSTAGRLTTAQLSPPAVRHIVGQALSPNQLQLMLTPFDDDTSAINDLSERVSALEATGGGDVSALSDRVVSLEALISNAISAGSATASNLLSNVNAISNQLSAVSVSAGGGVVHGLQSVINAMSLQISSLTGGGVTADQLSAVSAQAASAINVVSAVAAATDNRVSVLSGLLSLTNSAHLSTDQRVSLLSAQVSLTNSALGSVDAHANAASAAATSVDGRVTSLGVIVANVDNRVSITESAVISINNKLSAVMVLSAGGVSTFGLQSALDALSNRISAAVGGDITSVDARVTSLEALLSNAISAGSATASAICAILSAISARTSTGGATSIDGVQSAIDALSNQVSDVLTSVRQVSADAIANDASVSAVLAASVQAASAAAIANDASVSAVIINNISAQMGAGQFRMVTNGQNLSTGTFTKVSGLSLSLGGSNFYKVEGQINYAPNATSGTAVFQFGMSATQQPIYAAFQMAGPSAVAGGAVNSQIQFGGESAICLTPSVMYSIKPGVSGFGHMMFFDGIIQCSTAAGVLKVVAAATTTNNGGCTIRAGSYIRAFRIG